MLKKWYRIAQFSPSFSKGPSAELQAFPDLAGLVEGSDAALPFPDTVLHPPSPKRSVAWRWPLIALVSTCAAGGIAVGAFLWLINLPPNVDCQNTSTVSSDRAQLYCAQVAAQSGDLKDILTSLDLVKQWSPEHPLYGEVQPLVNKWSDTVLKAAQEKLNQNGLNDAIALISHIPTSSPNYQTAQSQLLEWRQEWQAGQEIYAKGQEALKQKDWQTAFAQVVALSEFNNIYWRVEQVQVLSQQIQQEKQSQRLLAQAQAAAAPGGIDQLSGALRAASQIERSTYTWQEAQSFLDNWSDQLLSVAADKWYAAQLDDAISLSQRAALNPNREQVAQDLIWLSQSRKLALKSSSNWRTSVQQVVSLYQAMLLANQIEPGSRFYPQAQSSIATWKVHLQDLSQLQVAQTIGQLHNKETLEGAIAKAAAIPADHPRRQQAQTLISHWQKEIQRIEDQPYLAQAHQLAQSGSVEQLKAAVATANQISPGRALRLEAQSWIYVWNNQIATLEDQPILDRARSLASEGNWSQAILEASVIKPSRPLFREARRAISTWQGQIEAIERAQSQAERAFSDSLDDQSNRRSADKSTNKSANKPEASQTREDHSSDAPDPSLSQAEEAPTPRRRSQPPANDYSSETTLPTRIYTVPSEEPVTSEPPSPLQQTAAPSQEAPAPLHPDAPSPKAPPVLSAPPPDSPAPQPIDFTPPTQEKQDTHSQVPSADDQRLSAISEPAVVYMGALYVGR